ncbi:MAG: sigma-70 family RNA polymerase sigma factor [Planctomycetes bacterium]|nr:sigma-70 family RNA polymerase sigma factor [Planctomycetota bacterium]
MTSRQTKEQIQSEDPAEWVDLYGDMLLSYALSRMRDRDIAEDLVQETFLVAWKSKGNFAGRSRFSTWLVSILRRKIADHFRREGSRTSYSFDESDEWEESEPLFNKQGKWTRSPKSWSASPEKLVENREFWTVVTRCLGDMPTHLAYVLRLRELKSAKTKDICNLLEITSSNVSVRLHRARLLLRQCLEEKWFE